MIVALGLCLCAALIAAYFLWFRTTYQVLFADLRPLDAATITAALDEKHISYQLKDGAVSATQGSGTTILVPAKLVHSTRLQVMSEDLPLKGQVGFELFNKSDMGLTEFAQKINYQRALQGELARTIMSLDGVDSARVHLSLPDATVFREDRRPPKASVTIASRTGQSLTSQSVQGIQRLVAGAVADLDVENVVILDNQGRILGGTLSPATQGDMGERGAIELYYSAHIRRALANVFLPHTFEVTVKAGPDTPNLSTDAFSTWSPGSRKFGLQISVLSQPAALPALEEQIKSDVANAIGMDPRLGDSVVVAAGGQSTLAASPPAVLPTIPTQQPAAQIRTAGKDFPVIPLIVVAGFVALVAAFAAGRLRTQRMRLTPEQRRNFVRRLTNALDEGDDHAAASV